MAKATTTTGQAAADQIRSPDTVRNMDCISLANRIDANVRELQGSSSSKAQEVSIHDRTRAREMLATYTRYFNIFASEPELDLPKFNPTDMTVPEPPELVVMQNFKVRDVVNLWAAHRVELLHSDSANARAAGFSSADAGRIVPVLEKMSRQLDEIDANPAIDLPDVAGQTPTAA